MNLALITDIVKKILFYISIVSAIFSIFFIFAIIWVLIKSKWLSDLVIKDLVEFLTFRPFGIKKLEKTWSGIIKRLEGGVESEMKLAIIEAEDVLDEILEKLGYKGETFGERLVKVPKEIMPSIDDVFEAHKIHNNIIHDPDYRLYAEQAKQAIEIYKKALLDLEAF